ncbi:eukaryotic translation initiation factor 3 subunit K [Thecamonas trahens ATCC 50062]|uniref:Eukaryotic translation initiation factor 3 subunit K n=1 Tax=Thecamonas trahens ATCC 50062 TaxID=461836 RepID=A0A0L0DPI7_THETB|nr:eukaryotic translation initiation factor 3 subunit K [Thecamonas trahens ATCC 50062]KNC54207.1 eukaryotic translation initiation factor 3 subunit K [Thecamonas trahens ATCC 50062]|eukprot:XP_013753847.1 eukaryotic translation initiation factor 3 subunit K [Thecamonas trahens ATCC 50062]
MSTSVAELLKPASRFDVNSLPAMEKIVREHVASGEYNVELNLAVLKLYQFNPQLYQFNPQATNEEIISLVLAKAMMALPAPDFQLALYLIPEAALTDMHRSLVDLANLLDTAKFRAFWDAFGSSPAEDLLGSIAGFGDAIRGFAASVVSSTFQLIDLSELADLLFLDQAAAAAYAEKAGWAVDSDNATVSIPLNEFNQAKAKEIKEDIRFEQIAQL